MKHILFAGGGTGGHLFPGLALAAELKTRTPEADILFATASRSLDRDIVAKAGFATTRIGISGWQSGILKYPAMACGLAVSFVAAIFFILRRRVEVVIGLGGYASFAPVVAGRLLRRRVYLLEQNTIPGRSNRMLSRFARAVFVQFESSAHFFKPGRAQALGNPVRAAIRALRSGDAPGTFTLLVIGGSQGALRLNEIFIEAAAAVDWPADSRIIHLCGTAHEERCRELYAGQTGGLPALELKGFADDMSAVYRAATLAVCRSGATSLAELTCVGIPLIMVPFPYATDDHQYHNAVAIEAAGGGICIRQEELTPARLAEEINGLISDAERLTAMRAASREAGRPEAGGRIADVILNGAAV